jgi:hypothetical protein
MYIYVYVYVCMGMYTGEEISVTSPYPPGAGLRQGISEWMDLPATQAMMKPGDKEMFRFK